MSLCRFKRAASRGIMHTFGRTATRRFTGVSNGTPRPLTGRADLCHARRVVVKLGSNVIAGPSNTLAVGCIGSIVEQVSGECESQELCGPDLYISANTDSVLPCKLAAIMRIIVGTQSQRLRTTQAVTPPHLLDLIHYAMWRSHKKSKSAMTTDKQVRK